jgi:hypothetical protein
MPSSRPIFRSQGAGRNRIRTASAVKIFMSLIMLAWAARGPYAQATGAQNAPAAPILVELFTSEGCSSCPPADALLERMDASQPIPGVHLIVLSEHVDYWNHDGWKDPYSSALITDRQSGYVHSLGLNTPYTPQFIIDGNLELKAGDPEQARQVFQKDLAAPKVSVRIDSVTVDPSTPAALHAHIAVNGDSAKRNADVFVAVALDHAESQVSAGENAGHHLTHVAVLQELTKIGKLTKGKNFDQEVQLKLKPGTEAKNVRIIAFVQEPGPGRVLGTALQKPVE